MICIRVSLLWYSFICVFTYMFNLKIVFEILGCFCASHYLSLKNSGVYACLWGTFADATKYWGLINCHILFCCFFSSLFCCRLMSLTTCLIQLPNQLSSCWLTWRSQSQSSIFKLQISCDLSLQMRIALKPCTERGHWWMTMTQLQIGIIRNTKLYWRRALGRKCQSASQTKVPEASLLDLKTLHKDVSSFTSLLTD